MNGPGLGGSPFGWARRGVQFATFDVKVDSRGASVMANIGRFSNKHGIRDVSTSSAPLLDGANLRSFLAGGLAAGKPGGFEFLRQGLELAFGLFNQVIDLVGPSLRVIESVDHLLERERELRIDRRELSVAGDDLAFDTAVNVGGGKGSGRGVCVEPR